MCDDSVGVPYWQAPEVRYGSYDAMKVDVWSLGATVWEVAETEPPFERTGEMEERWPPLSRPAMYSRQFHDFLLACSEPAESRPTPKQLVKVGYVVSYSSSAFTNVTVAWIHCQRVWSTSDHPNFVTVHGH